MPNKLCIIAIVSCFITKVPGICWGSSLRMFRKNKRTQKGRTRFAIRAVKLFSYIQTDRSKSSKLLRNAQVIIWSHLCSNSSVKSFKALLDARWQSLFPEVPTSFHNPISSAHTYPRKNSHPNDPSHIPTPPPGRL